MTDSIFEIEKLRVSLARKKIVFMSIGGGIKWDQTDISTYRGEH